MADQQAQHSSGKPSLCAGSVNDPALASWKQLAVSFLKMQRRIEEMLAPHDLALSQFEALAWIGVRPGMIQQDLVSLLLVTKGNVGALLDRLESNGMVERRPDPQDRRAKRLYLTAAGQSLVSALLDKHLALVREMMRPIGRPQQEQLRQIMETLEPGKG